MMDNRFQKGQIYETVHSKDNEIYVGSTSEELCKRMAKHRFKMKNKPHYRLYQHMATIGVEHFDICLLQKYACESKEELRAKEGEWIRQIGTLKSRIAGRDGEKWYKDNREEQLEKAKIHRK